MDAYNALATATELGPHVEHLIRVGCTDVPAGHPVYRLLTKAITERDVQLRAIHLLAILSRSKANRDQCLRCLTSVGGTMEFLLSKFPVPSAAIVPLGGNANSSLSVTQLASMLNELPQIHIDIISILINVCDYKIDAAQFLELYNNNVMMCLDALCGFLRHLSVDYPLSVLLVANAQKVNKQHEAGDDHSNSIWSVATAQSTAVIRCVYELSTWKTFKEAFFSADGDQTDVPMPLIQAKFTDHIHLVNRSLTASPFLPLVTRQLEDWLDVLNVLPDPSIASVLVPVTEAALSNALLLITNMMSFTSEFTAKFRQYAAVNSGGLLEKVLMPMVSLELDILEGKRFTDADDCFDNAVHLARAARMLQLLLKVLGLLCFKVRVLRPTLLEKYPFICKRLIMNEVLMNSDFKVEFFALVVRFAVNCELEDSTAIILEQHRLKLDARQKLVLALRLNNPTERLFPINVFCPIYRQLQAVFSIDKTVASDPNVINALGSTAADNSGSKPKFNFSTLTASSNGTSSSGIAFTSSIEQKRQARRKAFGLADPVEVFEDDEGQQQYRRMKRRAGGTSTTEKVRTRREAMRRRKAFLARRVAMKGKSAAFEEEEVVEAFEDECDDDLEVEMAEMSSNNNTAASPEAIVVDDEDEAVGGSSSPTATMCIEVAILKEASRAQQQQQADVSCVKTVPVSASTIAGVTAAAPAVVRLTAVSESAAVAPPTAVIESFVQDGPFDLRPYRSKPPPFGVDGRYLCALTKQLMTTPVISPSGEVFEKESILLFIKEVGPHKNKCPLSGDDLYPRDLVVDGALKRELAIVGANYR